MIAQSEAAAHAASLSSACSPLKYQRLLRGWSQQDVINALVEHCTRSGVSSVGLTIAMVSRWENGHHLPSPFYRKHLCKLYHMNAAQLGLIEDMEVQR
jgi:transcriptional regulator with XRE-family HTH domain